MFYNYRLCLLTIICAFMYGCSLIPTELKIAEELIETAPDSALVILQNMTPDKYSSNKNRALYGLLMVQALDKKMLPLKPDSLLDFSIAYYQKYPDDDRLANCYLYKGRTYKYGFQYENAIGCYLKALDAVRINENYLLLGRINSDIADIYLYQQEYKLANQKYFEAYNYFRNAKQTSFAHYSLINIGKSYTQAKSYKNAIPYFQKVYRESKDSMVIALALQHIGVNYYESKQFDSALVYFRKVIHYPLLKNNRAIRYYYLSDLFLDLEQFDSAFVYAQKAIKSQPDIRTGRECYRILTNCESSKGNIPELNRYMSLYQDCSDSIRKIDTQTKGSFIETMYNTKKQVVSAKSRMWYLFLFLLLVILSSVIIYMAKNRKSKQEKLLAERLRLQQKTDLRKEVVLKKREILQRKIEEKRSKQDVIWKTSGPEERRNMILKMYEEILHLNDIGFFQKEMDTELNNMVNKLHNRYPALTEKEINWCCFYLLNIPTSDIMVLFNYKVDSLKRMKQRLVNKVGLAGVGELDDFLNAILCE